jgi:amino acid transporter
MNGKKQKGMTVFTLTMMTVAAVVSLRGLPMMAKEGLSMIFYILFAAIMFLVPASLVSAELGGAFSKQRGGVYIWVKEAFGSRWGFTAIWLQWIQNVVWYPTVLAFGAGALAYLFMNPGLAGSGIYTGAVILIAYWAATFITLKGTNVASSVTKYGVLLGTVLPGILIIVLGMLWLDQGNTLQFMEPDVTVIAAEKAAGEAPHARLFPHITGMGSVAFLAGIILLFAGVEVHAVHANEMKDSARQFPKSMFLAAVIIFCLFTLGSLSVAAVVPADQISLTAGLMQAFEQLLDRFHLGFLTPIIGLLNSNGMQINILLIQAIIVSLLASLYLFMDNVSVAFFVLSAMTVTLYLIMYILMYASAIKLRYTRPDLPRSYKVPGGLFGIWFIAGIGLLGVCFSLIVGFFPPAQLPVGNPVLYIGLVAAGMVICVSLPVWINKIKKPEWKQ